MWTLQQSQQVLASTTSAVDKAKAHFTMATTLDEIRDLFNEDIQSHGSVNGLESAVLLTELTRGGFTLHKSTHIGLYLSPLDHYRSALSLHPKAGYATLAAYRLFKNQFYDSFTDNPLTPLSQSKQELSELLDIGEGLQKVKDKNINQEEVKFILAIHYLQAVQQQLIGKDEGLKKFKKLLTELSRDYPQSLKPMTLEALSAGL
jgi:hypothetical protein